MTRLRHMMLEELERRNYSASTARAYIRAVEDFARYFKRSPDQLGPQHIRQYQAHLFRDRKLADNTVSQRLTALRFFYTKTLGLAWNVSSDALPKDRLSTPKYSEPARSRRTDRRRRQRVSSHDPDDAVRHRRAPSGVGPSPTERHQQQAHGRSHPQRQGPQGP